MTWVFVVETEEFDIGLGRGERDCSNSDHKYLTLVYVIQFEVKFSTPRPSPTSIRPSQSSLSESTKDPTQDRVEHTN